MNDDEEEWGGIDEEHAGGHKPAPVSDTNGASRPPTRAELRAIREAAALFGSGALKMQVMPTRVHLLY